MTAPAPSKPAGAGPQQARSKTDESLRTERNNTDQAIAETNLDVEEKAAELVDLARDQADAVLEAAREKADEKAASAEPGVAPAGNLASERAREDLELEAARAAADATLAVERGAQLGRLAVLLPLEREKTDRYLLTERARSDAALEHRDDFMAMVTHDLRSLLSGIFLHATALADQASLTDEGRRTAAGMIRIHRYVARMNSLIGDLVDVASIDAGKLAVRATRGDAVTLLADAVDAFAQAAAEKGVALETKGRAHALPADFDHPRLLQVLANLINNALKFTPRGGGIFVGGAVTDDELRITVRDTGPGIPDGMLEAIFERFWQVGKDDRRGIGLGLYISRCIVAAHGGKIWAESRLGAGTAFHFTIPGARGPAMARVERTPEELGPRR